MAFPSIAVSARRASWRRLDSNRAATITFGMVVALAGAVFAVKGRAQWFFQDEWLFFERRSHMSLSNFMEPANGHWIGVPMIAYRLLWAVFGLHTYLPYQAMTLLAHMALAVLLWCAMRRSKISPWPSTIVAGSFALFGRGYENVVWAFQITLVAPVIFALIQLLLADHDGRLSRRDALALGAGLMALPCSGVSLITTGAVGLALLMRRGWRVAALQTVPLGIVYSAWYLVYARDAFHSPRVGPGPAIRFGANGLRSAATAFGGSAVTAWLLAAVVAMGFAACAAGGWSEWRERAAIPFSLAVCAPIFLVMTGVARVVPQGPDSFNRSRYAHLVVAFLIPAVALGVDAMWRRSRLLAVPALAAVLIGVPSNVNDIAHRVNPKAPPALILAFGQAEAGATAPAALQPLQGVGVGELTLGWLRSGVRTGKIPRPLLDSSILAQANASLALYVDAGQVDPATCRPLLADGEVVEMRAGESIGFQGSVIIAVTTPLGTSPSFLGFTASEPSQLSSRYGPISLAIAPFTDSPVELCPT